MIIQNLRVGLWHDAPILKRCLSTGWMLAAWSVLILLALAAGGALVPSKAWGGEEEVVARVNGETVSRSDLQRLLDDPYERAGLLQELAPHSPESRDFEALALRLLIERRLILQEADRRNFTVSEAELDQALTAVRRRFENLQSFGEWMHERGLDDRSLFTALREGMLSNRVRAALVEGVSVEEEDVRQYYENHKEELTASEEVRLRIIAVRDEAAAEEILAALHQGGSFSRLAREKSVGRLAAQGGDTGWLDVRTLPPALRDTVGRLKAGDVGGPLRKADDEYLLVGLQDRRQLRATSLAEARSQIEQLLLATRQREAIQAWLMEQTDKSEIEVLLNPR